MYSEVFACCIPGVRQMSKEKYVIFPGESRLQVEQVLQFGSVMPTYMTIER